MTHIPEDSGYNFKISSANNRIYLTSESGIISVFDTRTDTWSYDLNDEVKPLVHNIQGGREASAVETLGGKIYAFGGYRKPMQLYDDHYDPMYDDAPVSGIAVYCETSKEFVESNTDMSEARASPGVGRLSGKIYIVGGCRFEQIFYEDGSDSVKSIALSNVETFCKDSYEPCPKYIADMNHPRAGPAVVGYNGHLYVFGGWNNDDGDLNTVEMFTPCTNTWTLLETKIEDRIIGACLISKQLVRKS